MSSRNTRTFSMLVACTAAVMMLSGTPLYAVSGTGVTVWRIHNDSLGFITRALRIHKVNNSHVDSAYDAYTDGSLLGHPVINTHGTHVAFMRSTGTSTAQQYRVSVIRIDTPKKIVDLALFGKDTPGYLGEGAGQTAWPQGDWIYFTTANLCRFLYRVNARTRVIEFVTLVDLDPNGNFGRELKMSAVGYRVSLAGGLYFTLPDVQAAQGKLNTGQWPNGAFTVQGCGHTISPSGNLMGNQVDPGHYIRIQTPLNWQTHTIGQSLLNYPKDRNRWSLDRSDPYVACMIQELVSGDSIIESIGVGDATYGNAFSVNSDKWESLNSGYAPDGREGGNGRNLVLFNLTDSVTMNVSRGPRRNNGSSSQVAPGCVASRNWYIAEETGFFVSAPAADILPELRADATSDYTVPGLDDATQFPALVMMAQTPANGLPTGPVGARGPAYHLTYGGAGAAVGITSGPSWLRLDFGPAPRLHEVAILDAHGALMARRTGAGRTEDFTSRDGIGRGVYFVQVGTQGRSAAATVTVM